MQFLITYDIADERRRARLATVLLDYARRIEESVFLANALDDELAGRMRERVRKTIEPGEDCVHVFPLCAACLERVEVYGRAEVPRDESYYVV